MASSAPETLASSSDYAKEVEGALAELDSLHDVEHRERAEAFAANPLPAATPATGPHVFYATTRLCSGACGTTSSYTEVRDENVVQAGAPFHVGWCTGTLAAPAQPLAAEGAAAKTTLLDALHAALGASKSITVLVHGYNSDFSGACGDAIRFEQGTAFDGPLLLFSWPVRAGGLGGPLGYLPARATADDWSPIPFANLLEMLLEDARIKRVNLVAHSMGSRIVLDG